METDTERAEGATASPHGRVGVPVAPWGPTLAFAAGLGAGWMAAGAVGLLAHPLRHALTWLLLGAAMAASWRLDEPRLRQTCALVLAVAAARDHRSGAAPAPLARPHPLFRSVHSPAQRPIILTRLPGHPGASESKSAIEVSWVAQAPPRRF